MQIRRLGYFWLDSWVLANVIQLSTQDFCRRFLNLRNDPCGRQFDQMTQAARSGVANIAEGSSRRSTSKETEMKLTDVARASIAELANDYVNWLLQHDVAPWSTESAERKAVVKIVFDKPVYKDDVQHQSSLHILNQKHKFDTWLNSKDSLVVANCLLALCDRLIQLLTKQIENQLEVFKDQGGFTEALTTERLKRLKKNNEEAGAPTCPKCGKPMLRRMAKKGVNSGKEFWSCSDYPNCRGTREI